MIKATSNQMIRRLLIFFSLFTSISLMAVFASSAYAYNAGGGGAFNAGGSTQAGNQIMGVYWETDVYQQDWPATMGGVESFVRHAYEMQGLKSYFTNSSKGVFKLALDRAKDNCEERNKSLGHKDGCADPIVVAGGWIGNHNTISNDYGPSYNGDMHQQPYGQVPDLRPSVNAGGYDISINEPTQNGSSIYDTANWALWASWGGHVEKTCVLVVISKKYDTVPRGWYPTFEFGGRKDVADTQKITAVKLDPCPVYYYMTATGLDGYPRGESTATKSYLTPYGSLYNAVMAQKKTWSTDVTINGKKVHLGPYSLHNTYDDLTTGDDGSNGLKDAHDAACDATYKMDVEYDYTGDSGAGADTDDQNAKDSEGNKIFSDSPVSKEKFLGHYAKGGIIKIIKRQKVAAISYKSKKLAYFSRAHDTAKFKGWKSCRKGDIISADMMGIEKGANISGWEDGSPCGYIGSDMPKSFPGALADGTLTIVGGWTEIPKATADEAIETRKLDGKDIVGVYYRGTPIAFKCPNGLDDKKNPITGEIDLKNIDVNLLYPGIGHDMITAECTPTEFANDTIQIGTNNIAKKRIDWIEGGEEAWANGTSPAGSAYISSVFNKLMVSVGDNYQSIVPVGYQDFIHVNCNQVVFDKFISSLNKNYKAKFGERISGQPDNGQIDVKSTVSNPASIYLFVKTDTKFGGTAESNWVDLKTMGWGTTLVEAVPRFLERMPSLDANNASDFGDVIITAKDATGVDEKKAVVQYDADKTVSWTDYVKKTGPYQSSKYKAQYDPVYSKECPYDCTDGRNELGGQTGNATQKNNVYKKNFTADGPESQFSYGVKVWATDAKGNMKGKDPNGDGWINTTNMVFFRNNEWNQFYVDLYTPKTQSTSTGIASTVDGKKTGQIAYGNGLDKEYVDIDDIDNSGNATADARKAGNTADDAKARSTIVTRYAYGTPWFTQDSEKKKMTSMQWDTTGSSWKNSDAGWSNKDVFAESDGNNAEKYLKGDDNSYSSSEETSTQLQSVTNAQNVDNDRAYTAVLSGEANHFRIRSIWATDQKLGNLKFQFKWEYNSVTWVETPGDFIVSYDPNSSHDTYGENANWPAGSVYVYNSANTQREAHYAVVDGKCLSQENTDNPSPDTTDLTFNNSGSGTPDNDDKVFHNKDINKTTQGIQGGSTDAKRGWIEVTFVRGTAE